MEYAILSIVIIIIINIFILVYVGYIKTFRADKEKSRVELPPDKEYDEYRETVKNDVNDARNMPHKLYKIQSVDNLTLYGKYYEFKKEAPIEIMFHGYRSNSERDMSSGIKRAFKCGHNALLVDQRSHGKSEGKIITFGIKERYDCLSWINFVCTEFGLETEIILTGISMGAATVLMASSFDLPKNVIGVIADCGFNKPSDIIKKVLVDMKLSPKFVFPFIKLGGLMFAGFNIDSYSPYEAVQNAKVPIIFFHGTQDAYVPCYMSEKLFNACTSRKQLVTIEGGIHGTSYLKDPDKYVKAVIDFFK